MNSMIFLLFALVFNIRQSRFVFAELLRCVIFLGSEFVLHINADRQWYKFIQYHEEKLPHVFQTYVGVSKSKCALKCQESITSNKACSGANFNKKTQECDLSNDARNMTDADAVDVVALVLSTDYLISGPNGIPDEALTASSTYYHDDGSDPNSAKWSRLNTIETTYGDGAWTSGIKDNQQWIQARFDSTKLVNGIAIQGRGGNIHRQYILEFMVSYSTDCVTFIQVVSNGTAMVFPGNTDHTTIETRMLPTPVVALCVRLNPRTWKGWITLRWDIIGC